MHRHRGDKIGKQDRRNAGLGNRLLDSATRVRESEAYKSTHARLLKLRKEITDGKVKINAAREEIRSKFGDLKTENPDVFDALKTQANEVLEMIAEIDGQKAIID